MNGGSNTGEAYTFDKVGNRLSSLGFGDWLYNSSNQLTSTPVASFTYDNNGNTLTKSDANGTATYTWDVENRLASAFVPGTGATTFRYDPFGRRIQKSSPLGTTIYVYEGANVVAEYSGTGTLAAKYAQGEGVDQPLAMWRAGQVGLYSADGLGSITSLTDATGSPLVTYTYDAFGNMTDSGGNFVNPYRYTGREWDGETGLYYYRARYYDPQIGRFISEDPSAFGGGVNFYAYTGNKPLNARDPLGLSPQEVQQIITYAQNFTNKMTKDGQRGGNGEIGGNINDFIISLLKLFRRNPKLKGCGDQAQALEDALKAAMGDGGALHSLSGKWTIREQFRNASSWPVPMFPLPHQWLIAQSSDTSDPVIVLDPWQNKFVAVPPGTQPVDWGPYNEHVPGGDPSDPFGVNSVMNRPD